MCVTARLHGNEAEALWAKTLLPVKAEGTAAQREITKSIAAATAAAAASWDTMLSLQDSVFFEISIFCMSHLYLPFAHFHIMKFSIEAYAIALCYLQTCYFLSSHHFCLQQKVD